MSDNRNIIYVTKARRLTFRIASVLIATFGVAEIIFVLMYEYKTLSLLKGILFLLTGVSLFITARKWKTMESKHTTDETER